MLTIHVWPKRLKEFLLTHPLYKSPAEMKRRMNAVVDQIVGIVGIGNWEFVARGS